MPKHDTIIEDILLPDGNIGHIAVGAGHIVSIGTETSPQADGSKRIKGGGALALPGLIDGHVHLDKTFIGDGWKSHRACTAGFDVRERVEFEKEALATAAPGENRASALVEQVVAHGTTHLRCHVDIDPEAGLKNLDLVLNIRDRYRDAIDIQIVAFPQSGIVTAPGTAELLDSAMRNGADLVGGLDPVGFDRDMKGHLDIIFDLAERHGAGIDIHLHDPDTLGLTELEEIATRTLVLGMQGKVAVSHAYSLGEVPEAAARKTADVLARSNVSIMTNAPGNRPFPPVKMLHEAGVTVFTGNDNIRDSWWPYGEGDMFERVMIIGYRSGFLTDEDLCLAFDLATRNAAQVLGLGINGLEVGAPADFVLVNARGVPEAVVARPEGRKVFKRGRQVASDGRYLGTG